MCIEITDEVGAGSTKKSWYFFNFIMHVCSVRLLDLGIIGDWCVLKVRIKYMLKLLCDLLLYKYI